MGFAGMTQKEAMAQFKTGKAACIGWTSSCIGEFEAEDSAVRDKVVVKKCPVFENGKGDIDQWIG